MRHNNKGVSLIEVLLGLLIVAIASLATLTYFSTGFGSVNKTGNRRAALERARERLEQLMVVNVDTIKPSPIDLAAHVVTCTGAGVCTLSNAAETVSVDNLPSQTIISTMQCRHDVSAGTPNDTCDVIELSAKVWFMPGSAIDDDFNRVHIRTLRTPL